MTRIALSLALACTLTAAAQNNLTKSGDNNRTSENRNETILTPASVKAGMYSLPNIPVIGDAIGTEAQPLVDGAVMVLPSEANVVRGVTSPNAANPNGVAVWQTQPLCVPVKSDPTIDVWKTNDHIGMMGTGAIDGDTHKLYQVATCSSDGSGSPKSLEQRLFVLDDRTGTVLANVLVQGTDQGMNYSDAPRKQRAALLLWSRLGVKYVIVLSSSFSENGAQATGWLLAFDTFTNTFQGALSTKAGGWMSGEGPAEDMTTGLIYVGLGNGPFDGIHEFGESALQVQLTPATATTAMSMKVLHAWAPFSDNARTCSAVYPNLKVAGVSASSAVLEPRVPGAAMPMSEDCSAQWGDQDAHLTGTLVPERNLYVTAGKDGITYVIPTKKFPDTAPADFANPKANCAKVGMYQAGWDLGVDSCPVNAPALNRMYGGKTRHQHAPIAQIHYPSGNLYFAYCGENSPLQIVRVNPDNSLAFVVRGTEMASASVPSGMPGCFTTVTSNNGTNAIAWSSFPYGDANRTITNGFLVAYDLTHLEDTDASGKPAPSLPTLWMSAPYTFSKFSQPLVLHGHVYLAGSAGFVNHWSTVPPPATPNVRSRRSYYQAPLR